MIRAYSSNTCISRLLIRSALAVSYASLESAVLASSGTINKNIDPEYNDNICRNTTNT